MSYKITIKRNNPTFKLTKTDRKILIDHVQRNVNLITQGKRGLKGDKGDQGDPGAGNVDSVNGQTGVVVLDTDDIDDSSAVNKYVTSADLANLSNLSGVNTGDQDLSGLQPLDSDLTAIGGLSPSNDDLIQRKAGTWVNRTPAQIKTDLALTKSDVGLGNVDNTSDLNKPISTSTQSALDLKENLADKGQADGYAELDGTGRVPSAQLPAYVDDVVEAANFASLPVTGESGKIYVTLDTNLTYRWSGSAYVEISTSLALGETSTTAYRGDRGKIAYDHSQLTSGNPHNVTKSDVGLSNVDNTSDANKPVSTAQATADSLRVLKAGDTMTGDLIFSGSQKIIGGTSTTADLTLQTTSGVGASGADMHFLVGNNGATEAVTILNSGNVGIGTTAPTSQLEVVPSLASKVGAVIKGASSQTADLQQWANNSGTPLFKVTAVGSMVGLNFHLENGLGRSSFGSATLSGSISHQFVGAWDPSIVTMAVIGAASQTADLQQWRNSVGTVLGAFKATGRLVVENATISAPTTPQTTSLFVGAPPHASYTGQLNVSVGSGAGSNIRETYGNVFVGAGSGQSAGGAGSDCYFNTCIGVGSGNVTTGRINTFIGAYAGAGNTTGAGNTVVGSNAYQTGNASYLTLMGAFAGTSITSALFATIIGYGAGGALTSGNGNTFLGVNAGLTVATGIDNVFLGYESGRSHTGSRSVFVGVTAGYYVTGDYNVMIGSYSGVSSSPITTGTNNVIVGYNITGDSPTASNQTNINGTFLGTATEARIERATYKQRYDASNYLQVDVSSGGNVTMTASGGRVGIGITPTAALHLKAGTATASTAPLKLTTGTSLTVAEAGAVEFTTDDLFFTITTGAARKRLLMADPVGGLTSGRVPFATTNGRLTDASGWTFDGTSQTLGAGHNLVLDTGTGTKIGTATTQKLGFYNATPIVQPSAYTQTYSTADKIHANFTSADIGIFTGGSVGFLDAAERDNIRTQFNALRADVADAKQIINSLIDDLQSLGIVA